MLNQSTFHQIVTVMGTLEVDLFASRLTRQLPHFYSWRPDPEAEATDAFMQDWSAGRGYANSPWCLIPRCLTKVKLRTSSTFGVNNTFMENSVVVSHSSGTTRGLSTKDSTARGPGLNADGSGVSDAAGSAPS